MSKKRVFNLKLDFFVGFYESFLYNCDTAYYAIKNTVEWYEQQTGVKDIVSDDDFDFDFKAYSKDVRDAVVDVYPNFTPDIVESIKFGHMWSPREYNFATDEIYCNFKLTTNWRSKMMAFMKENAEWLKKRIREDWSSRDGFISFMDNCLYDWYDHIFKEMDERYIGSMISYMMILQAKQNGIDDLRYAISMYALDDIYPDSYVYMTNNDAKIRYKAALEEAEKLWK